VAKLYARYGYVLFRRCMVYLGDPSRAQAAVREVFVRALRAAAAFRGDAEPRRWLCRIADQFCVDRLRRSRRNPEPSLATESEEFAPAIEAAIANDDRGSLLAVRRLAEGLDPDSFRLAVLYFVDELTHEELATELGLSQRTIAKRVQLLLQRARTVLEPEIVS